nr:LCP family protein [Oscillospiraceae bacterium]
MMKNSGEKKKLLYLCGILILILVMIYSGLQILESAVFLQQDEEPAKTKTITRDGVDYFPRQDITVVMLLGIGEWGEAVPVEPNMACSVDMITLMIFDEKKEEVSLLSLNRDTMVDMPMLDEHGRRDGTYYGQLTYSHMYGTGMEDSCENTRQTVSDLLYGINIDYFISMKLDAIAIMNDAVGGVTVNIEDDFTHLDPGMVMGEVTLTGKQAVTFVQSRREVGDHLNVSRIRRQQEYMENFVAAFRGKAEESDSFVIRAYDAVSPYIVTDCSATVLTSMMQDYASYTLAESVTPEGENTMGKQFYEFYVDEEKLDDLVLRLFYAPKK